MAKKDISKSIRLTQEVYDYIDEAAGNGFNEKFENIILEAKAQESERKKRLAELEKYIRKKQDELNDLFDEYRYLDEFSDRLFGCSTSLTTWKKICIKRWKKTKI